MTATAREPGPDFAGTPRFEVKRRLGAGGFGVVYEAFDRERGSAVALKLLHAVDPGALYLFKQEFRGLADVVHRNLVTLHELVSTGESGHWFFTMELVDGVSFLKHVRPGATADGLAEESTLGEIADLRTIRESAPAPAPAPAPPAPGGAGAPDAPAAAGGEGPAAAPAPRTPVDAPRLRAALAQLAEGVAVLHAAGKLHRDLKPPNVLVTPEGRVVILDFGLATELKRGRLDESGRTIIGTVGYMSPEQAGARPIAEASDWYSVGVMLYEALTGVLPFRGKMIEVLTRKQAEDPPPPRALSPSAPADLDALCLDLLSRDPAARPRGGDVLRRLAAASGPRPGAPPAVERVAPPDGVRAVSALIIGRERHLDAIGRAFAIARAGATVSVHVHGRSGMGKSALVRHFLEGLADEGEAVVLHGRCYERESVPYKALDSLIDALSRYLLRCDGAEAAALLPRDVAALARLFPVLRRVEAVARAPRAGLEAHDAHEARRRASSALKDLLGRIAARRPLVLSVDDLQWGDVDSAALLLDLIGPPSPPLLFVAAYRTEEADRSPILKLLRSARPGGASEPREVEVGPLAATDASALAFALLGEGDGSVEGAVAATIARESGGNPFFVGELVRYVLEGAGIGEESTRLTLERVLGARVDRLPAPAERLLEVAAVAGRPIAVEVAGAAAGIPGGGERRLASLLKAHKLVETRGAAEDRLEPYHDRIRETVVARLGDEALKARHLGLARAFEAAGEGDPETLAVHFLGAGDLARAGRHATAAAASASAALAFDRAARLYGLALEAAAPGSDEAARLRARLADSLRDAGRGAEAAPEYLAAAAAVESTGVRDGPSALELRRLSAEQFLLAGRIDEGLSVMKAVLGAVGLKLARSPLAALVSLLLRTVLLRLRGLRFREREAAAVPPSDLVRIDVCWSAASALSHVDLMRAAELQARHMLLALRAGEVRRIARALTLEAGYSSLGGSATRRRTLGLVHAARAFAERIGSPEAHGRSGLIEGAASFFLGDWRRALERVIEGDGHLREGCTGVAWEVETLQFYILSSLYYLGEWSEIRRRLPPILRDARERGDLYTEVYVRCQSAAVPLWAGDAPDAAFAELRESLARWPRAGFLTPHWWNVWSEVQTALYAGDARRAHARIVERFPAIRGAMHLRVQFLRVESGRLKAASALALARAAGTAPPERKALLAEARAEVRRLERDRRPWSDALARLLRAGLAAAEGDPAGALEHVAAAEAGFEGADMALHAAAARRVRGALGGGETGREHVAAADRRMVAQGIVSPGRVARMLAPGFADEVYGEGPR